MLHLYLFSTAIFMLTVLLNLLTASLPRPRCTSLFTSSHPYSVYLSNARELTSIFTLSSFTLENSEAVFLCLFFHLPMN